MKYLVHEIKITLIVCLLSIIVNLVPNSRAGHRILMNVDHILDWLKTETELKKRYHHKITGEQIL